MAASKDPVALIISRMAAVVALLVATVVPVGFGLTELEDLSSVLEFKAEVKASALEGLISSNPDLWMFAENRIQGLIAREPVPLANELVRIFNAQNELIVQSGEEPERPVLSRRYSLFDGNRRVGQIEVSASLRGTIYRTLLAALLGLLLGVAVFVVMRVLPLRALRRVTTALNDEKDRAQTTLGAINDAVSTTDDQGCFLQMNPAALTMFRSSSGDPVPGQSILELIAPEYRSAYGELLGRVAAGESVQLQFEVVGDDGVRRWLETNAVPFQGHGDAVHLNVTRDITERKLAEQKINELAFYDQLTGLPNRTLLLDRVRQAMMESVRSKCYCAVLFIDLDRFKTLNDTLGHEMGDLLLAQVAQRLVAGVRACDTVARLGGDEFVVMLAGLSANLVLAVTQAETVGETLRASFNQAFELREVEFHSSPSIGVSLFTGKQTGVDELLKQADLAMYKSKDAGGNAVRFFDPAMEVAAMQRVALENDLRAAIMDQQFVLHYQAQMEGELVTGAEVLVRWQHPKRGIVSPGEFISLAEEAGLIRPLGGWVLETACAQLALWADRAGMNHLTLAVNVSASQFVHQAFVDEVSAVLERTGANPQRLKLELTESVLVSDLDQIVEKMETLKAKGVLFSLDDFGTGYSSLSYLKRLPFDQLKIDQSFVRELDLSRHDAAIAKTIVTLGASLGMAVIAEGVETAVQRDLLARMGCNAYQGYFFSRPLPLAQFETFARSLLPPSPGEAQSAAQALAQVH